MIVFERIKSFFQKIGRKVTPKVGLIVIVVLCVAALVAQYFQRSDAISFTTVVGAVVVPFQRGINEIGSFLFKAEQERLSLDEANEKIAALEEENNTLKREVDEYKSLAVENKELRALLEARERLEGYEAKAATVIGNSGVNVFSRFTVNLGSADGIKVDMNVINEKGLVGIVTSVGPNYAIVTTIIEDNNRVAAMTKNGHENCIVTGVMSSVGHHTVRLENAQSSVNFSEDNTLVTSDISDKYLPNLLIGYVTEVNPNPDGLRQSGFVETAVDFSAIRNVLIITTMRDELTGGTE